MFVHSSINLRYSQKFPPGENFHQFATCFLLVKIFLSCSNDYIEDMVTFTTLANLFHQIFLQYKGSCMGLVKLLSSEDFLLYDT